MTTLVLIAAIVSILAFCINWLIAESRIKKLKAEREEQNIKIQARIAYLKEVLNDVEEGLKLQNILTESGQINKERPFDEETFEVLEVTEISNQIRALEWVIKNAQ